MLELDELDECELLWWLLCLPFAAAVRAPMSPATSNNKKRARHAAIIRSDEAALLSA